MPVCWNSARRRPGRSSGGALPDAGLAHLPSALLGAAHSDHPLRRLRAGGCARRGSARPAAEVEDFRPTGTARSPLAAVEEFVHTRCPRCGGPGRRETDVSDTFVDSAWYFLRYPSTEFDDRPWDPDRTAVGLPVDFYAGGPEHVQRHHLYARFMTMALHDWGWCHSRSRSPGSAWVG